jgi:hypothetical protein
MDKITASLATIPKRVVPLQEMVESIIDQVDVLQIYLNGFTDKEIPVFLFRLNKVRIYRSQDEHFGDRGDAGKFFNVQNIHGWHFICDDDIHYPEDFVTSMIQKSEEHHRRFVVGCHGGDFNKYPVLDSYKCRKNMAHYKKSQVDKDYLVHFLATNSVCFHDDTVSLNEADFPQPNMADIWLGLACQKKKVGMLCRKKKAFWVQDCKNYDPWDSIYGHRYDKVKGGNADIQTEAVNSLGEQWRHYGEI